MVSNIIIIIVINQSNLFRCRHRSNVLKNDIRLFLSWRGPHRSAAAAAVYRARFVLIE